VKAEEVARLYDGDYARTYDERFLLGDYNRASSDFEIALLASLLTGDSRWLDIGCGTGYFLAGFPGIKRAGLDLSPDMLAVARARNPDALFFKQGDFREEAAEWAGAWTLVSCMWAPYSYVESIEEVARLVSNMIEWTAPGGTVLIPTIELPYLGENVPFSHQVEHYGGPIFVNGYVWSWDDLRAGKRHERLILPHGGQFVDWLAPWFERIRIVRYPGGRKAILATGRRRAAETEKRAAVDWDPPTGPEAKSVALGEASLASLLAEAGRRLRPARLLRRWRR
jgi:SAM-dependent methyltransferase